MIVFTGTKEITYQGLPYLFKGSISFWKNEHDYKGEFFEHAECGKMVSSDIEPSADELADLLNLNQNEYAYDELDRQADIF